MSAISDLYLLDGRSGKDVPAVLLDTIGDKQLDDWEHEWVPFMHKRVNELTESGASIRDVAQTLRWDWNRKVVRGQGLLSSAGFSVISRKCTQGMMLVELTHVARLPGQRRKPIVYVDYLETAPWNQPQFVKKPRLRGVGSALIVAAIAYSQDQGFNGRIGLHSLPQAEAFYRDRFGMTALGKDPGYQDLCYFEMTPEQARAFYDGDGQ